MTSIEKTDIYSHFKTKILLKQANRMYHESIVLTGICTIKYEVFLFGPIEELLMHKLFYFTIYI
jgi:hypothetical protein